MFVSWDSVKAARDELEQVYTRVANGIANGHAFRKRAKEFVGNTGDRVAFADIARRVISSPKSQVREMKNGGIAFYEESTNTLVIVKPNTRDGSTMMRPRRGRAYFDDLDDIDDED